MPFIPPWNITGFSVWSSASISLSVTKIPKFASSLKVGADKLLIIGTFQHSLELEQVLTVLEHNGIARKHMLVIPMDTEPTPSIRFTTKARDLYAIGFEVGVACATGSAVIGTSIGFIFPWGPIFTGLIAAVIGFTIAFGIYLLINKGTHQHLEKLPEITIIVQCPEEQSLLVMETMWEYRVLTVGRTPEPS